MSVDGKVFEFIVLEPVKFGLLKTVIQRACLAHDLNKPNTNQMTLTIGIGYPPEIIKGALEMVGHGQQRLKLRRIFDFSNEGFLAPLIRSSTIQLKISFSSDKECRNFLSHLHYAVTCPIVFLSQPFEVENINVPVLAEISPHLSWEIRYGIQMIKDCGNIYHFQKQNYIRKLLAFISQRKIIDAVAYLSAIHANLKLQPLMEVIEEPQRLASMTLKEDFVLMRTVIVTPTRTICCPPMPLMSSRAFRLIGGSENFIQVIFWNEDMQMMKLVEMMMREVVLNPGLEGSVVAGKRFFDLARFSSMFREHGSYFYQTDGQEDIVDTLKSLGNFKPEPSSNTGAKVGQDFTSTREVAPHEYTIIHDYMSRDGKVCFSDGVGIISQIFAKQIQEKLKIPYLPSAFRIQFLGLKDVLSIDDKNHLLIDAGGDKLVLFRESQKKFDVSSNMPAILGIVKHSAPGSVRLNKPLLNLLDQAASKQELTLVVENCADKLFTDNLYNISSSLTCNSTYDNFQRTVQQVWVNEPFFRSMVTAFALQQLRALPYHKQLSLPKDLGRSMLGIVDVTEILKQGQVFVQYNKQISTLKDDGEKIIHLAHSDLHGFEQQQVAKNADLAVNYIKSEIDNHGYSFVAPHKQQLSLPWPTIFSVINNSSSPIGLMKLFQTCKYFYSKRPTMFADYVIVSKPTTFTDDNNTEVSKQFQFNIVFDDPLKNISVLNVPIWFTEEVHFLHVSNTYQSLPKLFRYSVKVIEMVNSKLLYDDFVLLTAGEKVQTFLMYDNSYICYQNGTKPQMHLILGHLPNILKFSYVFDLSNCSRNDLRPLAHMTLNQPFQDIYMEIEDVHDLFDLRCFCQFIMQNSGTDTYFHCQMKSQAAQKRMLSILQRDLRSMNQLQNLNPNWFGKFIG